METPNDPEKEAWQALARSMERSIGRLLARFDAQLTQASETLADEIQDYLADQASEK
jgi:hypothetical protein